MSERRTLRTVSRAPGTRTRRLTCDEDVSGAVHELLDSVQSEVHDDDEDSAGCHDSEEDEGAGSVDAQSVGEDDGVSDVEDSGGGGSGVGLGGSVLEDEGGDDEEAELDVEVELVETDSAAGSGLSRLAAVFVSDGCTPVGKVGRLTVTE